MTKGDVHFLLAQAQDFHRAGDAQAAVMRAREAVMASADDEMREAAELAVERYEAALRAWRDEVAMRESEHRVLELTTQGLSAPSLETVRDAPPRKWGWIARVVRAPRAATSS